MPVRAEVPKTWPAVPEEPAQRAPVDWLGLGGSPIAGPERIMFGRKRFEFPSKHVNPLYTYKFEQIHRV